VILVFNYFVLTMNSPTLVASNKYEYFTQMMKSKNRFVVNVEDCYVFTVSGAGDHLKEDNENHDFTICIRDHNHFCTCQKMPTYTHRMNDPPSSDEVNDFIKMLNHYLYCIRWGCKRTIFVHCEWGMSRSVGAVAYFIMQLLDKNFEEATQYIKDRMKPRQMIAPFDFLQYQSTCSH